MHKHPAIETGDGGVERKRFDKHRHAPGRPPAGDGKAYPGAVQAMNSLAGALCQDFLTCHQRAVDIGEKKRNFAGCHCEPSSTRAWFAVIGSRAPRSATGVIWKASSAHPHLIGLPRSFELTSSARLPASRCPAPINHQLPPNVSVLWARSPSSQQAEVVFGREGVLPFSIPDGIFDLLCSPGMQFPRLLKGHYKCGSHSVGASRPEGEHASSVHHDDRRRSPGSSF